MQVSSGFPLRAENTPPVLLSEPGRSAEPWPVEDEEFPSDLSGHYDWMLQPASQSNSKRIRQFVVVLLAIFLIAISLFVAHRISGASSPVLASPALPSQ
jgi:hypothetical protein